MPYSLSPFYADTKYDIRFVTVLISHTGIAYNKFHYQIMIYAKSDIKSDISGLSTWIGH